MLTDHEAYANAFTTGGSPSPFYNTRIRRMKAFGVDAVEYTPGDGMLADAYSRFQLTKLTREHEQEAKRCASAHFGTLKGRSWRVVGA